MQLWTGYTSAIPDFFKIELIHRQESLNSYKLALCFNVCTEPLLSSRFSGCCEFLERGPPCD